MVGKRRKMIGNINGAVGNISGNIRIILYKYNMYSLVLKLAFALLLILIKYRHDKIKY